MEDGRARARIYNVYVERADSGSISLQLALHMHAYIPELAITALLCYDCSSIEVAGAILVCMHFAVKYKTLGND